MPSIFVPVAGYILKVTLPPIIFTHILLRATDLQPSTLETTFLHLVALLSYLNLLHYRSRAELHRLAKAAGAILPPAVPSRWWVPGGMDVLYEFATQWSTRMPGALLSDWKPTLGNTFSLKTFWSDHFYTDDPDAIKHMLTSSKFPIWGKGEEFHSWFDTFLGTGIFNSDPGENWKWHRAITRPHFDKSKISDLHTFDRHSQHMVKIMAAKAAKGEAFDCQDLFGRFTLDSATEFLMGGSVGSLDELESGGENARGFLKAFNTLQYNAVFRSRWGELWRLAELFGSADAKPMTFITPLVDGIIERAIAKRNEANNKGEEQEHLTLVDFLVTQTQDIKVIRDEILNILLASRDTTASLLTSTVHMWAKYPDSMKRAREEVLSHIGKGTPTFEDLKSLKYIRAVLNETLRVFPPVPFNVRCPSAPDVLPTGHYIPASCNVIYGLLPLQRSKDLWGPDAETWDPDRWLEGKEGRLRYMLEKPFIFQPFSAGPRICLGQQFAYNEATFALVRMLQRFTAVTHAKDAQPKSSYLAGTEELLPLAQITLIWKDGMYVRFQEAAEQVL